MSNTGLVRTRPRGVMDLTQEEYERLNDACATLALGGTMFLPKGLATVAAAKACGIVAIAYGYDPILAVQWMWAVEGKITFHYRWQLAMAVDRVPTLRYAVTEHTDEVCSGWMQRSPDHPKHEYTYRIEDARKAGVVKDGSAWVKNPKRMLFSKWASYVLSVAVPDLILGPPDREEIEDEFEQDPKPAAEPSVAVVVEDVAVEALGVKGVGEPATVQGSAAAPGTPPETSAPPTAVPPPVEEKKPETTTAVHVVEEKPATAAELSKAFRARAKQLGFKTTDNERMRELISGLLGVNITDPAQVSRADWMKATELLDKKYPKGPEKEAAAAPPMEGRATGASEAPTAADLPVEVKSEAAARAEQLQTPEYLLSLSQELERAWKQEGTVVKEHVGCWWFISDVILKEAGFKKDGRSQAMCLGKPEKYPDRWLKPEQVMTLCTGVLAALAQARNGGRPVVPKVEA